MTKRYVLAEMKHETNTFSPQLTGIEKFGRVSPSGEIMRGPEAIEIFGGTNTAFGGFYELLKERDAEVEVPLVATAWPSGLVTDAAFEEMAGLIVEAARSGPDAMFLSLHGAMVTESYGDAEGELLRRIRQVAPGLPIAVALDFHLGMSPELCANATVVTGYRTYPHIDIHETAQRAGATLLAALDGVVEPVISWGMVPMMTNMLCQTPLHQPMKDIMDRAIAAEASGEVLTASVFGGFPLSDIPYTGLSVIVVSDGDKVAGDRLRDELLSLAWERRADFVFDFEPMADSVSRAAALGTNEQKGPIVLADHGDNCGAGGITDVMAVLEEVGRAGLEDVVAGPYCDPATVELAIAAGVGAEVTLDIGGKVDMPAIAMSAQPLTVTAKVAAVSDGKYLVTGPMGTGTTANIGNTVLLETGIADILVSSLPLEPVDLGFYTHIGIDPTERRYLLIKSRQHFRAVFEPIASEIVPVAGPGVCSEDYSLRTFQHIRRPMYPMDRNTPMTVIGN